MPSEFKWTPPLGLMNKDMIHTILTYHSCIPGHLAPICQPSTLFSTIQTSTPIDGTSERGKKKIVIADFFTDMPWLAVYLVCRRGLRRRQKLLQDDRDDRTKTKTTERRRWRRKDRTNERGKKKIGKDDFFTTVSWLAVYFCRRCGLRRHQKLLHSDGGDDDRTTTTATERTKEKRKKRNS